MDGDGSDEQYQTPSDVDTEPLKGKVEKKDKLKTKKAKKEKEHGSNPKGTTDVSKDSPPPAENASKAKASKSKSRKVREEDALGSRKVTDLSTQTTHQLLMHPSVLSAGCVLLQNLKSNAMTAEEVGKKIGLKKGPRLRSDDDDEKDESNEEGVAVLRELIKRSAVSLTDPVDDDGDINEGLAGALFGNIEAKKKMVLLHAKAIQKLTPLQLREIFAKILSEVAAIYKGAHPSIRQEKFKLGRSEEKRLKELHVTYPFNQVQSGTVIDLIYQSFFSDKSRRHNWSNYVNDVLVPETFIRIYAYVNNIDNESAEKELLYAEEYDGPVHKHLRKKQRNAREKQLMDLAESREKKAGDSKNGVGAGDGVDTFDSEESINGEVSEMHIDADASNSSIEEISAML